MMKNQSGNVFIFVLLGVTLFAALAFTISRSMNSTNVTKMSERELKLVTTDIVNYAQRIQRAVEKVRRNGCSENDISFENNAVSGYEHTPAAEDKCKIFNVTGGSVQWQAPPPNSNDGTAWFFGANNIKKIDNSEYLGTSAEDLTLILADVNIDLCDQINEELNGLNVWESGGAHNGTPWTNVKFTGDFTIAAGINRANSWPVPEAGCFCDGSGACSPTHRRYFYKVLLIR